MKKLLFVLLLTISSIIHAQWIFVDESVDDTIEVFIEKSTIQQIGKYKRAWFKFEYSSNSEMALKHKIRSSRVLREYDCNEKKVRNLSTTLFKQPDLTEIDESNNQLTQWKFVPPKSIGMKQLLFVCNTNEPDKDYRLQKINWLELLR